MSLLCSKARVQHGGSAYLRSQLEPPASHSHGEMDLCPLLARGERAPQLTSRSDACSAQLGPCLARVIGLTALPCGGPQVSQGAGTLDLSRQPGESSCAPGFLFPGPAPWQRSPIWVLFSLSRSLRVSCLGAEAFSSKIAIGRTGAAHAQEEALVSLSRCGALICPRRNPEPDPSPPTREGTRRRTCSVQGALGSTSCGAQRLFPSSTF